MIEGVPITSCFLAVIHLLDIAYLSEWLNHNETPFKMIKFRDSVKMTGTTNTVRI